MVRGWSTHCRRGVGQVFEPESGIWEPVEAHEQLHFCMSVVSIGRAGWLYFCQSVVEEGIHQVLGRGRQLGAHRRVGGLVQDATATSTIEPGEPAAAVYVDGAAIIGVN